MIFRLNLLIALKALDKKVKHDLLIFICSDFFSFPFLILWNLHSRVLYNCCLFMKFIQFLFLQSLNVSKLLLKEVYCIFYTYSILVIFSITISFLSNLSSFIQNVFLCDSLSWFSLFQYSALNISVSRFFYSFPANSIK